MNANLKRKLLSMVPGGGLDLSDIDLLRLYIRQELITYRAELKQYRLAVADRKRYKHNALTPQPREPFIGQTVTQAIDELLRCERTSLPKLTFQVFMLQLDMEEKEAYQRYSEMYPLGFDVRRHLN